MTPEERAADILYRCWWQEERDPNPRPEFKGLDVEIAKAIREAIAEQREADAKIADEEADCWGTMADDSPEGLGRDGELAATAIAERIRAGNQEGKP